MAKRTFTRELKLEAVKLVKERGVSMAQTAPLHVEVSLAGKARVGGNLQFLVVLRNAGSQTLQLPARPGWDAAGGLQLRITQVNGPTQVLPSISEPRLAGPQGRALAAGTAMGVYRTVATATVAQAAGQYRAVVTYSRPGVADVVSAPFEFSIVP